jgi:5-methylcytosine-specific restriction endonuclease McrA
VIPIKRGNEPGKLAAVRTARLSQLRGLGRSPTSADISGYDVVAEELWNAQHHKCCYCEQRIFYYYNDVEHYRPKAAADRRPGCVKTHGYWWLAYSWNNLLYACPGCNRSNKNAKFPLAEGAVSLAEEELPPGNELALLLDPSSASENPVDHVEFEYGSIRPGSEENYWWARPRNGSLKGAETIQVCGLNRSELRELRQHHYRDSIRPQITAMQDALGSQDRGRIEYEYCRARAMLESASLYAGLTYDAFAKSIPEDLIYAAIGARWIKPS